MIRVTWVDGRTYRGRTPVEAVRAMRDDGVFTASKTDAEYIAGVARRISEAYGIAVLHPSAESLLKVLQQVGLVTVSEEH